MSEIDAHGDDAPAPRAYAIIFVALLTLLAVTITAAFLDLGHRVGLSIALGVAGLKAILIVGEFMHVRAAPNRVRLFAIVGFAWLAILATLTMSDYLTRGTLTTGPHEFRDPSNVQR